MEDNKTFSIFPKGYRNQKGEAVLAVKPQQSQDINWLYEYITSGRAKWPTDELRAMVGKATKEEVADFKKLNFETATPNGVFSYRSARSLVVRSPYMVLDIDDLTSTQEARATQQLLIGDPWVETALCFVSPKGKGVKWIVERPSWAQQADFKSAFQLLLNHVAFEYGIVVDKSGSDVGRACFLPHDPECYINKKFLIK